MSLLAYSGDSRRVIQPGDTVCIGPAETDDWGHFRVGYPDSRADAVVMMDRHARAEPGFQDLVVLCVCGVKERRLRWNRAQDNDLGSRLYESTTTSSPGEAVGVRLRSPEFRTGTDQ